MGRVSPKSDPQREELYRMEKRGFPGLHNATWSRSIIRHTLKALCSTFQVRKPGLLYAPSEEWSGLYQRTLDGSWARISLSTATPYGRSPMTLVHEAAHHVLEEWDPQSKLAPHGPEFAGIYGDMLAMLGVVPYAGFRAIATQYGIDVLDTASVRTIPQLRTLVKKRAAEAAQSKRKPLVTIQG